MRSDLVKVLRERPKYSRFPNLNTVKACRATNFCCFEDIETGETEFEVMSKFVDKIPSSPNK